MGLFGNWLPIQRYIIIFPVEVATQLGGQPPSLDNPIYHIVA